MFISSQRSKSGQLYGLRFGGFENEYEMEKALNNILILGMTKEPLDLIMGPLYKLRETPHPRSWWLSFRREKVRLGTWFLRGKSDVAPCRAC